MSATLEARLRFYLRPQFEDNIEFEERKISKKTVRKLLDCVRNLQASKVVQKLGFRDADLLGKSTEEEIMVEWTSSAGRTYSLLVNTEEVSAMLISIDGEAVMVQHGVSDDEIRYLFELFCLTDEP